MVTELTLEQKLDAVLYWQEQAEFHSLTCFKNSNHKPLYAMLDDRDNVILHCRDCDYSQAYVPQVVYDVYLDVLNDTIPIFDMEDTVSDADLSPQALDCLYRKTIRPLNRSLVKKIILSSSGNSGVLVDGKKYNAENIDEWERECPEKFAYLEYDFKNIGPCSKIPLAKNPIGITIHDVTLYVEGNLAFGSEEDREKVTKILQSLCDYYNSREYVEKNGDIIDSLRSWKELE